MERKSDTVYTNHPANKHDEWYKDIQRKRKAYKKVSPHITRDSENSTGNSESGKILTMSSHMHSVLCTDCGISQVDIKKWTLQPVKLGVPDEAQPRKWYQIIYYYICFPLFLLFGMEQKVPGLTKYTFQQGSLSY